MAPPSRRRLFIDWARGLAVLCMIEHHHFDAFLSPSLRGSGPDRAFRFLGGVAAPTFLFLAGLAVALLCEGQLARGLARGEVVRGAVRRGALIFLGAYLFRFQEWALAFGGSPAWTMLRIDVLNCIGVAIVAVALLWGAVASRAGRAAVLLAATALVVGLTPPLWDASLSALPQHLQDYVHGTQPRALFPLFPWTGYALLGAALGIAFASVREAAVPDRAEALLVGALALGAAVTWVVTQQIDALPFHLYSRTDWWLTSPAHFLLRSCSEAFLLCACWAVERAARPLWARFAGGPLLTLGRHSLLLYWVHIEIVYGRFTWRARGTMTLAQGAFWLAVLLVSMTALAYAADPLGARLSRRFGELRRWLTPPRPVLDEDAAALQIPGRAMIRDVLSFSLLSLSAIFFVVDPIAVIPIFVGMTHGDSEAKKRAMAKRAAFTAFSILAAFALAGTLLMKVLGVSLAAFKVAGGILLLITSIEMLTASKARTRTTPEEEEEGAEKEDVAIFPLAIPLLAGPGSIATVTALVGRAPHLWYAVPVVICIALTCFASYLMLRAATPIQRAMGVTGLTVMNRVIGLVIGALAVQFIFDGLRDAFPKVLGA